MELKDFRSEDGLFNLIKRKYPGTVFSGKDLFDASLFRDEATTRIFWTFMGELKALIGQANATPTHRFIHELHSSNKLLRCYTQNIDGLEARLGMSSTLQDANSPPAVVQLHGDMDCLVCCRCQKLHDFKLEWVGVYKGGSAVECLRCHDESATRVANSRRATPVGLLRPNIVLYNEYHANGIPFFFIVIWFCWS